MIGPWVVEIVPYDPAWPMQFEELRDVLKGTLREVALGIEHVGSTSVPALAAKPILDIDIIVASPKVVSEAIRLLARVGYQHQGDLGIFGREAFRREGPDVPRTEDECNWPAHHLYVCPQDSRELDRHLRLRDMLRNNADARSAYAALKRELVVLCEGDRDAYTEGKTTFIESLIRTGDAMERRVFTG